MFGKRLLVKRMLSIEVIEIECAAYSGRRMEEISYRVVTTAPFIYGVCSELQAFYI